MNKPTDLALFGAPPAFAAPLHVGSPNLPDRKKLYARFDEVLDSRWLTNNGQKVQELERRIANMLDVGHCIATANGTVAIELAIRAADLQGEIIVPSFTFVATAHAIEWLGLTPVFCDIDPETHNIDPAAAGKLLTDRTSAIMGVHVWGRPCAHAELRAIAKQHRLSLLFDAAHGFGCGADGRFLGNLGDAEIFSFHATKFVNSFEGGAVVTNDDAYADRMRLMRNFGFQGKDNVIELGINGKMSEVCAAMGLCSLDDMAAIVERNKTNYVQYVNGLEEMPGLRIIRYDDAQANNYQYVVVEIDEEEFGVSRDQLVEILHAENVIARRYFYPGCHQVVPYSNRQHASLKHTEWLTERVMSLPSGTSVDGEDIKRVIALIRYVREHCRDIIRRLPTP